MQYIDSVERVYRLSDLYNDFFDVDYRDHAWRPVSVIEFVEKHNLKIGLHSYVAIVCRWFEITGDDLLGHIDDKDLPTAEQLSKVIVEDYGDISRIDSCIPDKLYK